MYILQKLNPKIHQIMGHYSCMKLIEKITRENEPDLYFFRYNRINHQENKYLDVFSPLITENKRYPLDAVAISFYWIKSGYHIKTLKSLKHFHRKRMDSVSFVENEGSFESLEYFREEFLKL